MLLGFLQSHAVDADHPAEKMAPGELNNLERCYATMIPLLSAMGPEQASDVLKHGQAYLALFPNGKSVQTIQNCMNQAKAEGGREKAAEESAAPVAAEDEEKDASPAAAAESAEADEGDESELEGETESEGETENE